MVLWVSKRKPPPVVLAPSSTGQGDLFRARRGKRSFLWRGACGQVTGGGGGGRAGTAPAALSFTGSDVGPDGKNRQAPKKGQSFGVPSSVWKGVPKGLNTTGTKYLEDSALQGLSRGDSTKPGECSTSSVPQVAGDRAGPGVTRGQRIFRRDAGPVRFQGLGSKVSPSEI